MKKKLYIFGLIPLLIMTACKSTMNTEKFDYYSLYQTNYDTQFEESKYKSNKAMFGYTKNDKQGFNGWNYYYKDNNKKTLMTFDTEKSIWKGKKSFMKEGIFEIKKEAVVLSYSSDFKGDAFVYFNFKTASLESKSAQLSVFLNNNLILSSEIKQGDTVGIYKEIKLNLEIGDTIDFELSGAGSSVEFNPTITFENSQNTSLYHLTDFGKQYGDVFPWYNEEEHKLYMWYLWSDDCNKEYHNTLDISSNMIKMKNYPEANNFDLYDKLRHNYLYSHIFDVSRFIDNEKYQFGIRDNMLYKDEENKRYILIAGCYYRFDAYKWHSDLVIYTSKDEMALEWNPVGTVVKKDYIGHLPECPSLLKIGDRWYPFVSESHVTKHQIGALKYFIGDENVDCIDVDWESKNTYFLDGEDLCAARPTKVGDKTYLWGWITSSYNAVPLSPWAGYLNLPREIIQREDGTLGTRMDPGLVKYINYGNIDSVDNLVLQNPETMLFQDCNRNFITATLKMNFGNEAGFMFKQNNEIVKCGIEREGDKVYLRIRTPNDLTHSINAELEIVNPTSDGTYEIKLVIDNGIIEFNINDDQTLSASTKLTNEPYSVHCYGGGTEFSQINLNKLRSYFDCF